MMSTSKRAAAAIALVIVLTLALSGCGGSSRSTPSVTGPPGPIGQAFRGQVYGGQQPIVGVKIQLYAAGNAGYGSAYPYTTGASLLGNTAVVTAANGSFAITGDYTCPSASTEVYLVGTGGTPIAGGATNPNLALMTALGPCGNLTSSTFVSVNELTTVATIYALSPFMTGIANIGASSTNTVGLANAFASVDKLVNTSTGTVSGPALPTDATLPVDELNTLADMLDNCVNSSGGTSGDGSACGNLFSLSLSTGGGAPTDTITAMMNIAHNPGRNVNALNNLPKANAAFEPTLGNNPPEAWTIAITYTAGGSLAHPAGVAADQAGNIWIANTSSNSVTELAPTGIAISGGTGYAVGQSGLGAIAIDQNGNAWVPGNNTASLTKISKSGSTSTYAGGGLGVTNSLAIDGLGMVWAVDGGNNLSAFTNAGVAFSPLVGFTGGGLSSPQSIAITSR